GRVDKTCDRVPCVINTGVARNSQGEITHFIHTFRDISEEVKRQKEIQQRIKELSGLHAISQTFSSLTDVQETYGQLTGRIADLIGAQKCLIALYDQDAGGVIGQAPGYGVSARQIREFRCRVDQTSLEDSLASRDGESTALGWSICHDTFVQVFGAQEVLTVPTKIQGRVTGFIYAADKPGGFTSDDVKLLTIFAGQAATVIDNARLFDRIRRRLEELHKQYKVDTSLGDSLDLDEILNAILDAQLYDQVQSRAVRDERDRIAREMHDGLSQVLGYLNLQTKAVDQLFEQGRFAEAQVELKQMRKVVKEIYQDVRESIFSLRTSSSPGLSLLTAVTEYIHEFSQQNKIRVELVVDESGMSDIGPSTQIQLIRIIQEALTNVRKHAEASKALVRFEIDGDRARVTVEDDGRGFDLARAGERRQHFGLHTMRERAESVGGSLDINSHEGQGTRVTISLPLINKGGGGNGVDKNPSGG
ncbi:MAG: GAF domain-containing sensor histidine kinase, partial [Chloroflexi bacterium]|nr:GAF domain-containing sensor histidine kinase [Chloroflexota bacterium]